MKYEVVSIGPEAYAVQRNGVRERIFNRSQLASENARAAYVWAFGAANASLEHVTRHASQQPPCLCDGCREARGEIRT